MNALLCTAVAVALVLPVAAYLLVRARAAEQAWALDLGTTNSLLARWDPEAGRPEVLALSAIGRPAARGRDEQVARGVPTALHLGRGGCVLIGQRALNANYLGPRPGLVQGLKGALSSAPAAPVARGHGRPVSAREAAELYLEGLLDEARRAAGVRVRELVITTPVEAFETYRAELTHVGRRLGLRRLRFLDEPIAAALGYGLGLSRDRTALVIDFGGGTLDLALVRLSAKQARTGEAEVIAKAGRALGGDLVDAWLADEAARRLGLAPGNGADEEAAARLRLLRLEACRVKEAVYFDGAATFEAPLPEPRWALDRRLDGRPTSFVLTREALEQLLEQKGVYAGLEDCVREVLERARQRDLGADAIDDVLMVGGSTLLPGVFSLVERRFGRDRVRAWQPFEAVALGAAVFAAGRAAPADHIVHDYALETWEQDSRTPHHAVVVPAGTRFPTPPDLWKRQLVPACRGGVPEAVFKLVVCEVGRAGGDAAVAWDSAGQLVSLRGPARREVVVPLNASCPTLGKLRPPHEPGDRRPRLEVSFGVNADRWLCSTVVDLHSRRTLLDNQPVVRLL